MKMNYDEALEYIHGISWTFCKPGLERIEALCDEFCRDMERELALLGFCTTKRFSPGYSDLPLEIQRDIFRVLGCEKRIGLMLNESLLMSPSKSVTAIVGIRNL